MGLQRCGECYGGVGDVVEVSGMMHRCGRCCEGVEHVAKV